MTDPLWVVDISLSNPKPCITLSTNCSTGLVVVAVAEWVSILPGRSPSADKIHPARSPIRFDGSTDDRDNGGSELGGRFIPRPDITTSTMLPRSGTAVVGAATGGTVREGTASCKPESKPSIGLPTDMSVISGTVGNEIEGVPPIPRSEPSSWITPSSRLLGCS